MPKTNLQRVRSTPHDDRIGARIRATRLALGWSQERLGEAIGVSFQQIQKYENGANRISAGRLLQMADAFGIEVSSFFPSSDERVPVPPIALSAGDIELLKSMSGLTPNLQQIVRKLVREMAGGKTVKVDGEGA